MGFRNNFKPSNPVPCMNCSDRLLGCHDTCGKYKHYKEINIAVSKARNEFKRKISLPDRAFYGR
jgi:hypothetical protein